MSKIHEIMASFLVQAGSVAVLNSTSTPGYISNTVELNVTAIFNDTVDHFTLTVTVPVDNGTALGLCCFI